jgi:dihydroxyacetone kinase-like protein
MNLTHQEFKQLLEKWSEVMLQNKDYLIDLDSIVGDADLGLTMSEGFLAAYQAVKDLEETDIGKISYYAGKAMSRAVPSTMGTLMAQGFMAAGKALRGKDTLDAQGMAEFFQAYFNGVQQLGKAQIGEKTFLDGMSGSLAVLQEGAQIDRPLRESAPLIIQAAKTDLENTTTMLAKHGRAAARGEASRKLTDPGAAVAKLMLVTFADFLMEISQQT